jgi:hypothetical protein
VATDNLEPVFITVTMPLAKPRALVGGLAVYGPCEVCGQARGSWVTWTTAGRVVGMACQAHPYEHGPDIPPLDVSPRPTITLTFADGGTHTFSADSVTLRPGEFESNEGRVYQDNPRG